MSGWKGGQGGGGLDGLVEPAGREPEVVQDPVVLEAADTVLDLDPLACEFGVELAFGIGDRHRT